MCTNTYVRGKTPKYAYLLATVASKVFTNSLKFTVENGRNWTQSSGRSSPQVHSSGRTASGCNCKDCSLGACVSMCVTVCLHLPASASLRVHPHPTTAPQSRRLPVSLSRQGTVLSGVGSGLWGASLTPSNTFLPSTLGQALP